jgi:hypothetical protein
MAPRAVMRTIVAFSGRDRLHGRHCLLPGEASRLQPLHLALAVPPETHGLIPLTHAKIGSPRPPRLSGLKLDLAGRGPSLWYGARHGSVLFNDSGLTVIDLVEPLLVPSLVALKASFAPG